MKLEDGNDCADQGPDIEETLPLLAEVGIAPREDLDSRKLIVATTVPSISLVILRGSDVPTMFATVPRMSCRGRICCWSSGVKCDRWTGHRAMPPYDSGARC